MWIHAETSDRDVTLTGGAGGLPVGERVVEVLHLLLRDGEPLLFHAHNLALRLKQRASSS